MGIFDLCKKIFKKNLTEINNTKENIKEDREKLKGELNKWNNPKHKRKGMP